MNTIKLYSIVLFNDEFVIRVEMVICFLFYFVLDFFFEMNFYMAQVFEILVIAHMVLVEVIVIAIAKLKYNKMKRNPWFHSLY